MTTLARMHRQRRPNRAADKVRFTKQRPITRGGAYVAPTADVAATATVTALTPNTHALTGTFQSVALTGTGFAATTQVVYRKSGTTAWTVAGSTTYTSATAVSTTAFYPDSTGVWQIAVKQPGKAVSGSQDFTAT